MRERERERVAVVDMIRVREFDMERDAMAVEEMERRCEVGPAPAGSAASGGGGGMKANNNRNKKSKRASTSLYVDLLGDPMSRVRHTPDHVMLVAEYGEKREMVGVVRACIKVVTTGRKPTSAAGAATAAFARVAYILGLRVSPTHRRLGIGTKLVERVEEWCAQRGAEYAYMATDASNAASINLFTGRLSYARFRSPVVLVHPVHAHRQRLGRRAAVLRLSPALAEPLYRRLFPPAATEFFPADIGAVLRHRLTLGTFVALPSSASVAGWDRRGGGGLLPPTESFAVMSLWNCSEVFRLRVAGAPAAVRAALGLARALDERAPWMRVPSVRDVFRPFGVCLMYGLHMAGGRGAELMRYLCRLAHNIAMEDERCAAVVAEVGRGDPVRAAVPHWRRFSCEEDVWCMKRLDGGGGGCPDGDDWVTSPPSTEVIFVDPREF